jgi:ABC-type branched-subunit amino acid transport system permease subunit
MSPTKLLAVAAAAALVLVLAGLLMPTWFLFLTTMALSRGLAVLGIVVLMRGGGASFGQGMFFAIGAYVAAMTPQVLGVTDVVVRALLGTLVAGVAGAVFAPLLARYRGIFFAMLTLALSMVMYGMLSKASIVGGTDGLTVVKPTLFGQPLSPQRTDYLLYGVTVVLAVGAAWAVVVYKRSVAGLLAQAVRANDLRVEYLGASARRSLATSFVVCSVLGGLGGGITAQVLGHVEPDLTNWTTSGEFVFIAVLAGSHTVAAVFVASLLLEIVRSFSNLYFPNTWQLALGAFLLLVIWFRPEGIGSLWTRRRSARRPADPVATAAGKQGA